MVQKNRHGSTPFRGHGGGGHGGKGGQVGELHATRALDAAGEDLDEGAAKGGVEHGVDDGVGQGGHVAHPDEDGHHVPRQPLHARGARDGQDVDDEERCPQYNEHQEDDA